MSVSWVLHGVSLHELEVVVHLDLVQGVEGVVVRLVVTSADEVELLGEWVLHTLEIVWEGAVVVWLHLDGLHSLHLDVQLVNVLGILL